MPLLEYKGSICKAARAVQKASKLEVNLKNEWDRFIKRIILLWNGAGSFLAGMFEAAAGAALETLMASITSLIMNNQINAGLLLLSSILSLIGSGDQFKIALFLVVSDQLKKSCESRLEQAAQIKLIIDQMKTLLMKYIQLHANVEDETGDTTTLKQALTELLLAVKDLTELAQKLQMLDQWTDSLWVSARSHLDKAEEHLETQTIGEVTNAMAEVGSIWGNALGDMVVNVAENTDLDDDGGGGSLTDLGTEIFNEIVDQANEDANTVLEQTISTLQGTGASYAAIVGGVDILFKEIAVGLIKKVPLSDLYEAYGIIGAYGSSSISFGENGITELTLNEPDEFSLTYWNETIKLLMGILPGLAHDLTTARQFSQALINTLLKERDHVDGIADEIQEQLDNNGLNVAELMLKRNVWSNKVSMHNKVIELTKPMLMGDTIENIQQIQNAMDQVVQMAINYEDPHPYDEAVELLKKNAGQFLGAFTSKSKATSLLNSLSNSDQKINEGMANDAEIITKINSFSALAKEDPLIAAAYEELENTLVGLETSGDPLKEKIAMYIRNGNIAPLFTLMSSGVNAIQSVISGEAYENLSNSVQNTLSELSQANIREVCFKETVIEEEELSVEDQGIVELDREEALETAEMLKYEENTVNSS